LDFGTLMGRITEISADPENMGEAYELEWGKACWQPGNSPLCRIFYLYHNTLPEASRQFFNPANKSRQAPLVQAHKLLIFNTTGRRSNLCRPLQ